MQHYTIIQLEQGSDAWREWRHGGIGSSDAPVIMGESPFGSSLQLLRERRIPAENGTRRCNTPTLAMARGNALEPIARDLYCQQIGRQVSPVCLQSNRHEWLRASLDGMTSEGDLAVEIKCGEVAYKKAMKTRRVPIQYYAQVQHILAVTGLEAMDFWCYLPNLPPVLISVARDNVYIDRLLEVESAFWQRVCDPSP